MPDLTKECVWGTPKRPGGARQDIASAGPVVPVADPPAAVDPEVRNLLQSLGLGGHEAALVAKGGVSGMADLQGLSAAPNVAPSTPKDG